MVRTFFGKNQIRKNHWISQNIYKKNYLGVFSVSIIYMEMLTKNPQKIPKKSALKFTCKICDYFTSNKKDFIKHCGTTKHGIKWYIPTNTNNKYLECKNCDYISGNLEQMNNHFSKVSVSEISKS